MRCHLFNPVKVSFTADDVSRCLEDCVVGFFFFPGRVKLPSNVFFCTSDLCYTQWKWVSHTRNQLLWWNSSCSCSFNCLQYLSSFPARSSLENWHRTPLLWRWSTTGFYRASWTQVATSYLMYISFVSQLPFLRHLRKMDPSFESGNSWKEMHG